jgi:hypothetical protein
MRIDRQLVVRKGEPPYLGPPKRKASHLWPDSEDRTCDAVDAVLGAPVSQV